jgi:hypothetical protein
VVRPESSLPGKLPQPEGEVRNSPNLHPAMWLHKQMKEGALVKRVLKPMLQGMAFPCIMICVDQIAQAIVRAVEAGDRAGGLRGPASQKLKDS